MEDKKFYNTSDLVNDVLKTMSLINKIHDTQVSKLEEQVKSIKSKLNLS
jgi:hypothetical protein